MPPSKKTTKCKEKAVAKKAKIHKQFGKSLHEAVSENSLTIVKAMICSGANVDWPDKNGETPIFEAVRNKRIGMTLCLCKKGASLNVRNPEGHTPLFYAVKEGGTLMSKVLLSHGADPNMKVNAEGEPALHFAVKMDNLKLTQLLIEYHADVNYQYTAAQELKGKKLIDLAVSRGDAEILKCLILADPDKYKKEKTLFWAVERGNLHMVEFIVSVGVKNNDNTQFCHFEKCMSSKILCNAMYPHLCMGILKLMLAACCDAKIPRSILSPPMYKVAVGELLNIAEQLLNLRLRINSVVDRKKTVLCYAAIESDRYLANLLLNSGAKIDSVYISEQKRGSDENSNTVDIFISVGRGMGYRWSKGVPLSLCYPIYQDADIQIMETLLEVGCKVNQPDFNGYLPLHEAAKAGLMDIAELLILYGAKLDCQRGIETWKKTPLHWATIIGHRDMVMFLIREGAKVNIKDSSGDTALHLSIKESKSVGIGMVKLLISVGANINSIGRKGTPLNYAIHYKSGYDVVKCLLEAGCDFTIGGSEMLPPINHAAELGYFDIVKLLIEHGADVDQRSRSGYTPLHMAVFHGSRKIAKLLLNSNATVDVKCLAGKTPLHYSVKYNHRMDLVEILLKANANPSIRNRVGKSAVSLARPFNFCPLLLYCPNLDIPEFERQSFLYNRFLDVRYELNRMKVETISDASEMSLYNFMLEEDKNVMVDFVKNAGIYSFLGAKMFCKETYPLYCDMIMKKLAKAKKRELLLFQANIVMDHSCWKDLPWFLQKPILRFLTNKELKKFIAAALEYMHE